MSINTVEIRAFSGPATVELAGVGVPEIVEVRQGPQGPAGTNGNAATISVGTTTTGNAGTNASVTNSGTSSAAVFNFTIPRGNTGATGAQGPAGPNSVTSATTSDGTADLEVLTLVAVNGISTSGENAGIFTDGQYANISTNGENSSISTGGQSGEIFTVGDFAPIYTSGEFAYISTVGVSAYIQTRATFRLFDGTYTTTLSHTPTANRAIAFPDASGTLLISSQLGTGVATALAVNVGSAGAFVVNGGALGTPSSGTLTSCTGLPISTGVSGLAANVATFLATPSSANLAAALTDENGTGGGFVRAEGSTLTSTTLNGHALTTTSKYKSSDTTRSSNTFATDSDLTVSLAANSNYIIEIWLSGSVASAGGTLAIRAFYTGTLDAAITVGEVACVNSGSALAAAVFTWTSVSSPQVNMFESSTTNPRGNVFRFNLRTANAGDFELRWSNGNGAGTGSGSYTLHQGCSITATRIV